MSETKLFFNELCKKTGKLFIGQWSSFLGIFAIFIIPILLLYNYFWDNPILIHNLIEKYTLEVFTFADNVIYLFFFLFFLLYLIAVMKMIHAADQGKRMGVLAAYGQAFSIFYQYLRIKILYALKVLCWAVLFIIPGIVFGVLYNFSGMALLIDNKRGKEALILSRNIIKPNLSKYLAYVFLMLLILLVFCWSILVSFDGFIIFFTIKENNKISENRILPAQQR